MEAQDKIKKEKTTSFMKNVAMLMLAQVVIKILGFVYRLVIINIEGFGDVGNGYYQTINQIISYVFLAQAGFSDAVIYSLYKPFAEKNKDDINAIYGGSRKIFKIIGYIIFGIICLVTLGLYLFYNLQLYHTLSIK